MLNSVLFYYRSEYYPQASFNAETLKERNSVMGCASSTSGTNPLGKPGKSLDIIFKHFSFMNKISLVMAKRNIPKVALFGLFFNTI